MINSNKKNLENLNKINSANKDVNQTVIHDTNIHLEQSVDNIIIQ